MALAVHHGAAARGAPRLTWAPIDLNEGSLRVIKTLVSVAWRIQPREPKAQKGRRSIALDPVTHAELRAHRVRQLEETLGWGEVYEENDLVVLPRERRADQPRDDDAQLQAPRRERGTTSDSANDLRHSYATAALTAGVPVKVVSNRLGHANVGITSDLYMHVPDEMDRYAADRVADTILGARMRGEGS